MCPAEPALQINVISGYYSQVAGVLAGLSFAALVLLLGGQDGDTGAQRRSLMR